MAPIPIRHPSNSYLKPDLDNSGTINSREELEALCLNLVYRLDWEVGPDKVDEACKQAMEASGEAPRLNWDQGDVAAWFKEFVAYHGLGPYA